MAYLRRRSLDPGIHFRTLQALAGGLAPLRAAAPDVEDVYQTLASELDEAGADYEDYLEAQYD